MSDNVFAEVKTFWVSLPSSNPRVFYEGEQNDNQDRD